MKVLIVNTSELEGGAAIAAHRLYEALNKNGVDATMMVGFRQTTDPKVTVAAPRWKYNLNFTLERTKIWMTNRLHRQNLYAVDTASDGIDITETREFEKADVVHLHWINQGFLSFASMKKILQSGKRVVWTMHDMWPCTGICHYAGECTKFRTECHTCPLLMNPGKKDLSNQSFRRKRILYHDADIRFVTCSHWLHEQAASSALLKGKPISCIPNPLDTTLFCPGDMVEARKALSLPLQKKLILFGSQKVTDERKGMKFLVEMAHILKERHSLQAELNIAFLVVGQQAERLAELLSFPVYPMGYVDSTEKLVNVYRAADLYITPSLFDNLPNTIVEAMSCGTPCVGFRTGGIPEMIDHLGNGYVANYKDPEDLANGVEFALGHPSLGDSAHHYASYMYDEARITRKFMELYGN